MTECMLDFLAECPAFDGRRINVNFLDGKISSYSLECVPCEPVLKRYADGGMLCERRFALAMRKETSLAAQRNLSVAQEYEMIEHWIAEQENTGRLPRLGEKFVPISLKVIKSFGVTQTASMDMRLEAILKFVFYVGK